MEWTDILHAVTNSEKLKVIDIWVGMVRKGCGHLVHETQKSVSKEWVFEFSGFLHADCGAEIFG